MFIKSSSTTGVAFCISYYYRQKGNYIAPKHFSLCDKIQTWQLGCTKRWCFSNNELNICVIPISSVRKKCWSDFFKIKRGYSRFNQSSLYCWYQRLFTFFMFNFDTMRDTLSPIFACQKEELNSLVPMIASKGFT